MFGHNIQYLLYILKTIADINVFFFMNTIKAKSKKKKISFHCPIFKKLVFKKKTQKSIEVLQSIFLVTDFMVNFMGNFMKS